MYYAKAGGNLESVDTSGKNVQKLSNVTVLGIYESLWQGPKKGKGIVSYIESDSLKRFIGNVATTNVTFLPQSVTAAAWSPDGKQIAYMIRQGDSSGLTIADENGQKPKVLYTTPIPDFNVFWPSSNTILLASRPSGIAPGILFSFDIKRSSFEKIFVEQYGLTILPSPGGSSLLYAKTNASGMALSLALSDADGRGSRMIDAPTLPEKCVFMYGRAGIICAAPKNLAEFVTLPDDWYMGTAFFKDRFVSVNATTTTASDLFSEKEFDAFNLFMSLDNQFLFFQDKKDFTLWRLRLEP
ncbi:MAG: hypothetical protein A2934_04015 [Candidatus Sungbacteria bacterium RIFCSPLOWO2_01_FULL_47_10]|uniref:Dipeptidylpeptidase IV N-terminal domain-containing protein n=1 Tax=Candidatus Sungbacteria bacterium RIFCSPLOWO2_01_FULL_47_10 TaxID=1802276 RepID=A0A1G2L5D5_9BACT|nr:MAG: hypothetical protein A2934_04015 [Candidatus Sungbacteria bacterium RIFCSPLOWO2_01_FULL_47_10]